MFLQISFQNNCKNVLNVLRKLKVFFGRVEGLCFFFSLKWIQTDWKGPLDFLCRTVQARAGKKKMLKQELGFISAAVSKKSKEYKCCTAVAFRCVAILSLLKKGFKRVSNVWMRGRFRRICLPRFIHLVSFHIRTALGVDSQDSQSPIKQLAWSAETSWNLTGTYKGSLCRGHKQTPSQTELHRRCRELVNSEVMWWWFFFKWEQVGVMFHYCVLHSVDCWFKESDTRLCLWNKRVDAVWEEEKKQRFSLPCHPIPNSCSPWCRWCTVPNMPRHQQTAGLGGVGVGGEGGGGITIKQSASRQKSLETRPLQIPVRRVNVEPQCPLVATVLLLSGHSRRQSAAAWWSRCIAASRAATAGNPAGRARTWRSWWKCWRRACCSPVAWRCTAGRGNTGGGIRTGTKICNSSFTTDFTYWI